MGIDTKLTTIDLIILFNVTAMTVYNWRLGRTGTSPLPYHTTTKGTKRHGIFFFKKEVLVWAHYNKVKLRAGSVPQLPPGADWVHEIRSRLFRVPTRPLTNRMNTLAR